MYNSAVNTNFWARLNFHSFADFDPLMTNDAALKLWNNYKNKLLVQGKQTVVWEKQTRDAPTFSEANFGVGTNSRLIVLHGRAGHTTSDIFDCPKLIL